MRCGSAGVCRKPLWANAALPISAGESNREPLGTPGCCRSSFRSPRLSRLSSAPIVLRIFQGRPIYGAPAMPAAWLLPFAVPDHPLDLLLHRIEVEGGRVLHRRI